MQVAVAGMSITNRLKAIFFADIFNACKQHREFCTGYYGIFLFINRICFYCFSHASPHFPECIFLFLRIGKKNFIAIKLLKDLHNLFTFFHQYIRVVAIHFNDQVGPYLLLYFYGNSVYIFQCPVNGITFQTDFLRNQTTTTA